MEKEKSWSALSFQKASHLKVIYLSMYLSSRCELSWFGLTAPVTLTDPSQPYATLISTFNHSKTLGWCAEYICSTFDLIKSGHLVCQFFFWIFQPAENRIPCVRCDVLDLCNMGSEWLALVKHWLILSIKPLGVNRRLCFNIIRD